MSIYKVHFKWKEKEISLSAKNLDLTHPYFVSIKDLLLPRGSGLIINPGEDEIAQAFGDTEHIMIPVQSVSLIEELKEEKKPTPRTLSLMEGNKDSES